MPICLSREEVLAIMDLGSDDIINRSDVTGFFTTEVFNTLCAWGIPSPQSIFLPKCGEPETLLALQPWIEDVCDRLSCLELFLASL